jgi:hypothetical protein
MNVHRALSDVAEMRAQLDRAANYRGFRSLATGFSALVVLLGAIVQAAWVEASAINVDAYLSIWLGVAIASSALAGIEMIVRGILSRNRQVWITHRRLIGNLVPSMIVGSVLTLALANHALAQPTGLGMMWALPGIWAMIFGLGLFTCRHELPRPANWVAMYYLITGMICVLINSQLVGANSESFNQLSAWQMVVMFGLGQSFLGLVLYWNVERKYG